MDLVTEAEKQAQRAERLDAFGGINVLHIKRQISYLLGLIGREGIFDQYTIHDISHIDNMLKIAEWLIPDETKLIMSPADWLFFVLSVYFHDVGMLVTRQEFEERDSSGFLQYRDQELFGGEKGEDYKDRVKELGYDDMERFLYQEFVRATHAQRVRNWIMGRAPEHLGINHKTMSEIDTLMSPLHSQCRRDLGLICESHHLDDLWNINKYKVSQPYGNSDEETVNLQYIAILLRTVDLLHITADRTPAVVFRTINPSDPISQQEWIKQMAVKRVRPQIGHDRSGNPDEKAPRDTIEVHAYFSEARGFFGLNSYLSYASEQLRKSHEWVKSAGASKGVRHRFPWRYIDDSHIETEGFLRQTYEFTIDQAKILDLLTGHTLYNDTQVVLRELVQNALDAVRLQALIDGKSGGKIIIDWDSGERILSVWDNGTGMTQDIIERHLLKVGSSRYQEPDFKEAFPMFSPISRFGIGLLSVFMIADEVEIATCHPREEYVHHLSLRSVNGKYLIRLLDKGVDPIASSLVPHGTGVHLRVRSRAAVGDIVRTARKWIVLPEVDVFVRIDGGEQVKIGFSSPKEALEDALSSARFDVADRDVEVIERSSGGVTLAYAVGWSKFFCDWELLSLPVSISRELEEGGQVELGTCIEGVRVELGTPGFSGMKVMAIANATGLAAPKTNVVRSGLELTPERDDMLSSIYKIYCSHVEGEIRKLNQDRNFSVTWAVQEAGYLMAPLLYRDPGFEPLSPKLLEEAIRDVPLILVEVSGKREAMSQRSLSKLDSVWTIDCAFFRSAESLIREVAGPGSLAGLIAGLGAGNINLPTGVLVCGFGRNTYHKSALKSKEVGEIVVLGEQRRVDLMWMEKSPEAPRWRSISFSNEELRNVRNRTEGSVVRRLLNSGDSVYIAVGDVKVSGVGGESVVRAFSTSYVLPGSDVARVCLDCLDRAEQSGDLLSIFGVKCVIMFAMKSGVDFVDEDLLGEKILRLNAVGEALSALRSTNMQVFDPSAWRRDLFEFEA